MRLAVVLLSVLLAACTDFATPASLEKPTILAVTAEPPVVAAGEASRLDTVVVDGSGVLIGLTRTYALIETYPGVAPLGRLEEDDLGVRYIAPDPVPARPGNPPPLDTVQITIDGVGATPLTAIKVMVIAPISTRNPVITGLTIGPSDGMTGTVVVRRGETLPLMVVTDPPPGDQARFAWYTIAGTIERYQSNPAELVVDDEAESGWLFVAVRDGQGGVAWRGTELSVE